MVDPGSYLRSAGMRRLFEALQRRAVSAPASVLLGDDAHSQSVADALLAIERTAAMLAGAATPRLASRLDNGVDALLLDLAVHRTGGVHVALPPYFSPSQFAHALQDCDATWLALPRGAAAPGRGWQALPHSLLPTLALWRRESTAASRLPPGTAVVTYTSGTTGQPKGVCLDGSALVDVAASLASAFADTDPRRHMCALPLSTLLETVGVYAALLHGAEIRLPSMASLGYSGASALAPAGLYGSFARHRPHSAILVPQLLEGLLSMIEQRGIWADPPRLVAVGGARVGAALPERAALLGLPLYEGYGLTEAGSVVSLNTPLANRPGSVGRPLPHLGVSIVDGEVCIDGHGWLGYVGEPARMPMRWGTGDLGRFDDDGYLHLSGRRRNVFVTAYGRNVSPEWVESELVAHPAISQAVVVGEARPWNLAIIVPSAATAGDDVLRAAIADANRRLPDYARVSAWLRADAPFTAGNSLATANGRLRRDAILLAHAERIAACFAGEPDPLLPSVSDEVPA